MKPLSNLGRSILVSDEAVLKFTSKLPSVAMHAVNFKTNEVSRQEASQGGVL